VTLNLGHGKVRQGDLGSLKFCLLFQSHAIAETVVSEEEEDWAESGP